MSQFPMDYRDASWSFGALPRTRRRSPTPDLQQHALGRTQSSAPYPQQQISNTIQAPTTHPQLHTSSNMQYPAYQQQYVPNSAESSPEYSQRQTLSTLQSSPRHSKLHTSNSMLHPIAYPQQPTTRTTGSPSGHMQQNMGTANEFIPVRNRGSPFEHHSPQASPPPESIIIDGIQYIAAPQQLPNAPHPPTVPRMQSHTPNGWSGHYGPMHMDHRDPQREVSIPGMPQGLLTQYRSPEHQRRHQSVAPDIHRVRYNESNHTSRSPLYRVEGQGPQLGSPIWHDGRLQEGRVRHAEAQEKIRRGPAQVHGRVSYQYESSIRFASPRDDAPQTPPRQRARSRTRLRRASPDQRGSRRSKSTAPQARVPAIENLRTPVQYKSPTIEEHYDAEDYTPLNEVLRRQQVEGQMSRQNVAQNGYNAAHVLPKQSAFNKEFQKANSPSHQQNPMQTIPNAPRFQQSGSPMVIDLCTPSTNAGTPAKAYSPPRPMRERITPAQKPTLKRPPVTALDTTASPSKPKKQKVVEKEPEKVDPEAAKQRRAAEIIVNREMKSAEEASDLAIFGEVVGETEEEKTRKLEEEATKQRREKDAKLAILKAKEEAKEQAEREKRRALAEEEERTKLEKEQEEERKKAKRDADRKLREAEEERIREEKRKKAEENIEAQRQKAAQDAKRLEEENQAKEKTSGIQVDPEEIAKLKAKQEEAKKQAASLSSAKPAANKDTAFSNNKDVEMEDENSLFLPDKAPTPKKPGNRRSSSVGPYSAVEPFPRSAATSRRRSKLQQDRDARERRRLEQDTLEWRAKITSMWEKRKLSRLAVPEEPPLPRPESSRERPQPRSRLDRVLKKGRAPPKSSSKAKAVSAPTSENGSEPDVLLMGTISASLLGPQDSRARTQARNTSQAVTGINTPETSFDSVASAPPKFPPPLAPPILKSRVVTVSDQIEKLRFEREKLEKARKRNERNEKSRETARLKRTEQAREKKRLELLAEAEKNGIELTEENLNAQVEAYMEKREKEQQKRRESIARTEAIRNMAPDALALNQTSKFIPDDLNPNSDDEMTFNQHLKKKIPEQELVPEEEDDLTRATRESIAALRRERGGSFRAAAAKRTVADFQTDSSESESEEDPDDEPAPKPSKRKERGSSDGEDCDSDEGSETETGEDVPAVNGVNPDKHDDGTAAPQPDMNSSSQRQSSASEKRSTLQPRPSFSAAIFDDRLVWIYSVIEAKTIDGVSGPTLKGSDFLNRNEAIQEACYRLQTYRSTHPTIHGVEETYSEDDIYQGKLFFDEEKTNHLAIGVNKFPQAPKEIFEFDASKVQERVPVKTYILKLKTNKKILDEEMGNWVEIRDCDVIEGRWFLELEMANNAACTYLIDYIKPKSLRLDDIEQHANVAAPRIRERRDEDNAAKTRFVGRVEPEKGELEWMMPLILIEVEVVLFKMEGPIN